MHSWALIREYGSAKGRSLYTKLCSLFSRFNREMCILKLFESVTFTIQFPKLIVKSIQPKYRYATTNDLFLTQSLANFNDCLHLKC